MEVCLSVLSRISDQDIVLLGLDPEYARPEWTIWQTMPIPPPSMRPSVETEDGLSLRSWYKAAIQNKPTIIYFQGNADNIRARGPLVRPYLDEGYGVLLLGYRGYGGNPGQSSEKGLYTDGRGALDFLKKQGVKPQCMVLYGESLGTGVAIQLASEQPVGGVVLQAAFTSFPFV